jgi:hypothetical protein
MQQHLAPGVDVADAGSDRGRVRRTGPSWQRIFATRVGLWGAAVLVPVVTGNADLIPSVILLGSFLVPVSFMMYALERTDAVVTTQRVFTAFAIGTLLGGRVPRSWNLNFLGQPSVLAYLGVGVIEEAVKLAVRWVLSRHLPRFTGRDGMVLGDGRRRAPRSADPARPAAPGHVQHGHRKCGFHRTGGPVIRPATRTRTRRAPQPVRQRRGCWAETPRAASPTRSLTERSPKWSYSHAVF